MHEKQRSKRRVSRDIGSYCRTKMQKELIIDKLKASGFRLTDQRRILIDIILENECSSCKDIYYKASRIDEQIGIATVYRIVNILEEIGAINRKNMYKVVYSNNCSMNNACSIIFEDNTSYSLSAKEWNGVLKAGLEACGYCTHKNINSIEMKTCQCQECED